MLSNRLVASATQVCRAHTLVVKRVALQSQSQSLRHLSSTRSHAYVPTQSGKIVAPHSSSSSSSSSATAAPIVSASAETESITSAMPDDPNLDDLATLRKKAGFRDPSDPDFRYERTRGILVIELCFLFGVPLFLYHASTTVRNFIDEQIAWMTTEYRARFPATERKQYAIDYTDTKPMAQKSAAKSTSASTSSPSSSSPPSSSSSPSIISTAHAEEAKPASSSSSSSSSKDPDLQKIADSLELLTLLQMNEQIATLIELERTQDKARLNRNIDIVANQTIQSTEELPATEALRAAHKILVNWKLPVLPQPPRWSSAPRTQQEARERLDQLNEFKKEYEVELEKAAQQLRAQLDAELTPALRTLFNDAVVKFDAQLPERIRRAALATKNAIEASKLTEFAEVSREIAEKKAKEWAKIFPEELQRQRTRLEKEMRDILSQQEKRLTKENEPLVQEQLRLLDEQRQEIVRLEKELNRKKTIEKQGERVHRLTSLLIRMEESLTSDTKAQLFDSHGQVIADARSPKWAQELQVNLNQMAELSRTTDPSLHALVKSVPPFADSTHTELVSPSELRRSFIDVERAVREATFLPEKEQQLSGQQETNPVAALYAKAFAGLSMKEGQAYRSDARTDGDRLNNAIYFVNKERDLPAAVKELEKLRSPKAKAEAEQWIAQAKRRIQVEETVGQIRSKIEHTAKTYAKNVK